MIFYTTLISLSQIAVRLERAVSLWNTMSDSQALTTDNSTTGNSSNITCTGNSSSTDSETYSFVELQALSAVVGQIVTDACNYVSIYIIIEA